METLKGLTTEKRIKSMLEDCQEAVSKGGTASKEWHRDRIYGAQRVLALLYPLFSDEEADSLWEKFISTGN